MTPPRPSVAIVLVALAACAPAAPPEVPASPPPAGAPPVVAPSSAAVPVDAGSPLPEAVTLLQRGIAGGRGAFEVVESLTTEVGARLAGSPGDKRAVAWALDAMRRRGLANVHAEPVTVPVWQRGAEAAAIVAPVAHALAVTSLGWGGATPPRGVEADVVRFESMDALKAAEPRAVTGKIVFLDVKMKATSDGTGYGTAVVARASGPEEAAKKGALAVVIRSIGSDDTRFPHTGAMHKGKDMKSTLPAAAMSSADADLLERVLSAHGSARLSLTLEPRWLPDAASANVVGEVVGRDRPNEVVLLGAHLDSWDLGEGALDDGAGCGIVLEAGRAIAALPDKPSRTVRVVLFAAEENSLSGAKEYARAHAADAALHVAAMEADTGTGRVVGFRVLGGPTAPAFAQGAASLLSPLGVTVSDKPARAGADVSPLEALGVPILDLEQEPAGYFDAHHTANDTLSRIDAVALGQAASAFATTAWAVAQMHGDLGRIAASSK